MGFYIQGPPHGKAEMLVNQHAGIVVIQPDNFSDIPQGYALIVVVDNGPFEAAGLCYCEKEFKVFTDPSDLRPKAWVVLDKETAHRLANYNQ